MNRILFVCHGNICRSPMAELILKKLVAEKGIEKDYLIESRAVSREELGNPVYPPARQIIESHGISCNGKHAMQITRSDYENFDRIFVMDENNMRNITRVIGADNKHKIEKLLDFTGNGGDVPDPWYHGGFDKVFDTLYSACETIIEKLSK